MTQLQKHAKRLIVTFKCILRSCSCRGGATTKNGHYRVANNFICVLNKLGFTPKTLVVVDGQRTLFPFIMDREGNVYGYEKQD